MNWREACLVKIGPETSDWHMGNFRLAYGELQAYGMPQVRKDNYIHWPASIYSVYHQYHDGVYMGYDDVVHMETRPYKKQSWVYI